MLKNRKGQGFGKNAEKINRCRINLLLLKPLLDKAFRTCLLKFRQDKVFRGINHQLN